MRKLLLFLVLIYQSSIGQTVLKEINANQLKNNIIKSSIETKNIISEFIQYKHSTGDYVLWLSILDIIIIQSS